MDSLLYKIPVGRKGEEKLNSKFDVYFWKIIYQFVENDYKVMRVTQQENEVWLEFIQYNKVSLIRMVRYDIDWSYWLQRDMEYARRVVEQLAKRYYARSIEVLNIYVTTYPPVDDWEYLVTRPFKVEGRNEATMSSVVIHEANIDDALETLRQRTGVQISRSSFAFEDDDLVELQRVKQSLINLVKETREKEKQVYEYGTPFFTYMFIIVQVVMFLFLEWKGGSTNPRVLIEYGAKFNPLIEQGEWWRFITPVFLHVGFLHLLMNTLALYYLGAMVERIYGSFRFLFIYLFAGSFGTLGSFLFTPSVSAGASGAIFGLFGALLYFGTVYKHLFLRTIGMNIISLIGINLLFGFIVPGIDNAGHIGGLVGGFLSACMVQLPRHRFTQKQLLSLVITFLIVFAVIYNDFY